MPDYIRTLPLPLCTLWSLRDDLALNCNALVTGEITGPCQLVAPAALQRRLFDAVHAGPLASHLGPKTTLHQPALAWHEP